MASTRWRQFTAVLVFAALVRLVTLWVFQDSLKEDPDAYRGLAQNLARDGVLGRGRAVPVRGRDIGPVTSHETIQTANSPLAPSAYRPPLYPLVLAGLARLSENRVTPWSVAGLHIVLGVATVGTVMWLAQWVDSQHSERKYSLSLTAAVFVACDPLLLYHSAKVMTETLAVLLSAAALLVLTRMSHSLNSQLNKIQHDDHAVFRWAIGAGLMLGLAALCRPAFYVWLAMVCFTLAFASIPPRRKMALTAAIVAGAAIVIAPWVVRNAIHLGRPILATTHGGYTLWLGNNPSFYRHLQHAAPGEVWDVRGAEPKWNDIPPSQKEASHNAPSGNELSDDRRWRKAAWDAIRADPWMFAYACLDRIGRLWTPLASQGYTAESRGHRLLRYAVAVWYTLLGAAALAGVWRLFRAGRLRSAPWSWGILLCAAFTLVHTFYWTNMRMRAPLTPVVCLLAAAGLARPGRNKET